MAAHPSLKSGPVETSRSEAASTIDVTGEFVSATAETVTRDDHATLPTEMPLIAGYEITGELARGGMGRVLSGRELALDREVAIKTLLPGANASRFVTEARITAQLPHPNIPPVYALGTLADRSPYLAMKLVRGKTLAEELKSRPTPHDNLPRFLQIFEQIAQAVGFAHAQGIIHRDLKPANVMVGAFGEVQVMDWGLAKELRRQKGDQPKDLGSPNAATNEATVAWETDDQGGDQTQTGAVLGTPNFMAPEQARGEQATARSDVFALGGILCAILTGKAVFTGGSVPETIKQAATGDTGRAMELLDGSGVDSELIALAKECLAVEASARPENGVEVARLVGRYREGVEERLKRAETAKAEAMVREAEGRKRRRVAYSLGSGIAVALVAGLLVSLWQMNRAIDAEGLAKTNELSAKSERDKKEIERENAEKHKKQAQEDRDKAQQERANAVAVRDFLRNHLISRASVWEQASTSRGQAKHDMTVKELLNIAAREFSPQTIETRFPRQPIVQAEILETIGAALDDTDDTNGAIQFVKAATELREKAFGTHHPNTLSSYVQLAFVYVSADRHVDATRTILKIMERFESVLKAESLGSEHDPASIILDQMISGADRYLEGRRRPFRTVHFGATEGAMLLLQVGQAMPRGKRVADLAEARYGKTDRRTIILRLLQGVGYLAVGQFGTAVPHLEALSTTAAGLKDQEILRLGIRQILLIGYEIQDRPAAEIIPIAGELVDGYQRKLGPDHPMTLVSKSKLADAYMATEQYVKAIAMFEAVVKSQIKVQGEADDATKTAQNDLATAYHRGGQHSQAIALFEKLYQADVAKYGKEHVKTHTSLNNLALGYMESGQHQRAIKVFEELVASRENQKGDPESQITNHYNLAVAYNLAGSHAKAIEHFEKAVKGRKKLYDRDHSQVVLALNNMAMCYREAGKLAEAIALFEEIGGSLERRRFQYQNTTPLVDNIITTYELAKQFDKAEQWQRRWITVIKNREGEQSPAYATELDVLAMLQMSQKQWDAAEKNLRDSLKIRENKQPEDWRHFETKSLLGTALRSQKRLQEAEPLLLQGYEGMKQREGQLPTKEKYRLDDALERVILYYQQTKQFETVKTWQAKRKKAEPRK